MVCRFQTDAFLQTDETVHVSYEDQMRINAFSRLNKRKTEIDEEVAKLKRSIEHNEIASNEIYLPDDIKFVIGDTFVDVDIDQAEEILGEKKAQMEAMLRAQESELELITTRMAQLKGALYARFGKEHINLD